MADALGDKAVVVLRGHGLTSTGTTVEEAVLRAIGVDTLAGLSLAVTQAGGTLVDISPEDMAELPDLGSGLNTATAWRHELARIANR